MSKKQKTYPAEFKTKIVLELLSGDQTVSQIASKYSLISKSILGRVDNCSPRLRASACPRHPEDLD